MMRIDHCARSTTVPPFSKSTIAPGAPEAPDSEDPIPIGDSRAPGRAISMPYPRFTPQINVVSEASCHADEECVGRSGLQTVRRYDQLARLARTSALTGRWMLYGMLS